MKVTWNPGGITLLVSINIYFTFNLRLFMKIKQNRTYCLHIRDDSYSPIGVSSVL